jgi:hypothetical protein
MKRVTILLAICLMFVFMNCSPVSVKYDYDRQANFSTMQTFDWMPKPAKVRAKTRSLMDKRIKNAVNGQLVSKGFKQSSNPDFVIAYHTGVKDKIDVQTWGYTYAGRGRYRGWGGTHVDVQQYKQGTLVLDIIDDKSKELIWRGIATGALPKNPNPEDIENKINDVVEKVLENFPPKQAN